MRYLLDTSVYGVLVDEDEEDYEIIREIIKYAERNRSQFVTTLIISKELSSEDVDKYIRDVILPQFKKTIAFNAIGLLSTPLYNRARLTITGV